MAENMGMKSGEAGDDIMPRSSLLNNTYVLPPAYYYSVFTIVTIVGMQS